MVKCFSKKYGNKEELATTAILKLCQDALSAPDATSQHHCLKNKHLKLIWLHW